MDGVDISSSSENDDEETCETNNDINGMESCGDGNKLAMESDVDAELDYDEENLGDEGKSIYESRLPGNDDRCEENSVKHGAGVDQDDKMSHLTENVDEAEGELSEEGEIDDLEEGELKSDEESNTSSIHSNEKSRKTVYRTTEIDFEHSPYRSWRDDSTAVGVCKFYLRGACTWGPDCKYLHIKEPRFNASAPVQSSSSESLCVHRTDSDRTRRSRSQDLKTNISSRIVCPSGSTSNENEISSRGDETAWEKGLRQARELMIKASKKREEEPDFDRKRLVLAPSEDMDRPRTTDEESDDSRGHYRMRHRTSRSPLSRSIIKDANSLSMRIRVDAPFSRRRYDELMGPDDSAGVRSVEGEHRGASERLDVAKPRKIPSLIDTMPERRRFEYPRRHDFGRDEPPRIPPKDLGPQVLYPNGRPTARRRAPPPRREFSPSDRYYVPRRESPPTNSRSPISRTSQDSRSPSQRRSVSPPSKRRGSTVSSDSRRESNRKRNNVVPIGGLLSAGDHIHDPWERAHKKERSKDNELISLTLGAELQKTRRTTDEKKQKRRQGTTSSVSSTSRRSISVTSSASSHSQSRSNSRASSIDRHHLPSHFSLASAVASKNLIDDDGSLRATDLSSFRIPKKKRSSPASSLHRSSTVANRGYKHSFKRLGSQSKRSTSSSSRRRSSHCSGAVQRSKKDVRVMACHVERAHKRSVSPAGKEDISSDESSSSTLGGSSSSSDNAEPAAYRIKRKVDDGLPTEGIPLSPEAAAEDVSSDDDENVSDRSIHEPVPQYSKKALITGSPQPASRKTGNEACYESGIDDDDYVDSETEKEERRAELLRQLRCVEEAIARKRSRPVA